MANKLAFDFIFNPDERGPVAFDWPAKQFAAGETIADGRISVMGGSEHITISDEQVNGLASLANVAVANTPAAVGDYWLLNRIVTSEGNVYVEASKLLVRPVV